MTSHLLQFSVVCLALTMSSANAVGQQKQLRYRDLCQFVRTAIEREANGNRIIGFEKPFREISKGELRYTMGGIPFGLGEGDPLLEAACLQSVVEATRKHMNKNFWRTRLPEMESMIQSFYLDGQVGPQNLEVVETMYKRYLDDHAKTKELTGARPSDIQPTLTFGRIAPRPAGVAVYYVPQFFWELQKFREKRTGQADYKLNTGRKVGEHTLIRGYKVNYLLRGIWADGDTVLERVDVMKGSYRSPLAIDFTTGKSTKRHYRQLLGKE